MNKSNLGPCGVLFRVPNGTVPKLSLLPLASDEVSGRIIGLAGWLVRLTMSARTDLLKHSTILGILGTRPVRSSEEEGHLLPFRHVREHLLFSLQIVARSYFSSNFSLRFFLNFRGEADLSYFQLLVSFLPNCRPPHDVLLCRPKFQLETSSSFASCEGLPPESWPLWGPSENFSCVDF